MAASQEDGWVVCRVFKKKNVVFSSSFQQKNLDVMNCDGALRQILQYMGRSCKEESTTSTAIEATKLPALQSPTPATTTLPFLDQFRAEETPVGIISYDGGAGGLWSTLDQLITSEMDQVNQIPSFENAAGFSGVLCSPPPTFFAMDYYQLQIGDVSLQN